MYNLNLNSKDILIKIIATKETNNKDLLTNFIGNLLTPAGGDIASKVRITLTKDTLYLEYIGHVSIGYGEEVREIDTFPLDDITDFTVSIIEKEELITIKTKEKTLSFIRDNSKENNLASEMANILK